MGLKHFVPRLCPPVMGGIRAAFVFFLSHKLNTRRVDLAASNTYYQILKIDIDNSHCTVLANVYNNISALLVGGVIRLLQEDLDTISSNTEKDLCLIWGGDFNVGPCTLADGGQSGLSLDDDRDISHFVHTPVG